ncbi:MAG: MATE family efflux transporter, partial [Oscillospiraceae bacterium]
MTQPKFKSELLFSNKYLLKMIFPLIIEQFLLISVGIADIFMVSSLGEAAVSGISTIDVINVLLNQILIAVATGGAVVISHHLGKHDNNAASNSAKQLLYVVFFPSCLISIGLFFFHTQILSLLFKDLESAVMANACAYLQISALSYPFLAIYHAGSAI